ncbi:MAG: preprotein translocase subunit SecA [Candidatus Phytoplasma sp.]|nr:preprotein translocase subunit SecA [Phytoplasma sp.]
MLKNLFSSTKKELKYARKIADQIFKLEPEIQKLSDQEIKDYTEKLKKRYQEGETLDQLLVEAFALVREASFRVTKMSPYYVQVLGAIAIHRGNIAEMKTGEGKTLTSVMPAYLNALNNEGVHIVTVNEYLAKREAEGEIGDIFRFLGLTVGLNLRDLDSEQKKEAYASDILYSTNSELGFDYLRDHMVLYAKDMVAQRGYNYAIIDEVDSILIDEARTPLIISGGAKNTQNLYQQADRFVKSLKKEEFIIDIESKTIELTEEGINKAESVFQISNLYDLRYVSLLHHINNALRANYIMSKDKEYVVDNNEVLIVDQFTGRILRGRQFSEGLHQAIEAKENVEIKKETVTVATITYQNFFRMYKKLSGMTGTAKTEEDEFRDIYNMEVIEIPTNLPVIREDSTDLLYATKEEKFEALLQEVKERHEKGQPLLIGTVAVETSEEISLLLRKNRIPHEILNAKNHEREAEIIAKAGLKGSVTIATNMAGRGTDIKLGEGVKELGGLAVLGTERHESRRIDNQLRGRAGRQGDPGYSKFFVSGEDELLIRFTGDRFRSIVETMKKVNGPGVPLQSKMLSKFVTNAQKRIEANNYDARKNVLKYDDVLRIQREIIYEQRRDVLTLPSIEDKVIKMINESIESEVAPFIVEVGRNKYDINDEGLIQHLENTLFYKDTFDIKILEQLDEKELVEHIRQKALKELEIKKETTPPEVYNEFLKVIMLRMIDTYWMRHIDIMSELRQGVRLQAYGQQNPLIIYQQEGKRLFDEMIYNIAKDVTKYAVMARIQVNITREAVVKGTRTNDGESNAPRKQRVRKHRGKNVPWA